MVECAFGKIWCVSVCVYNAGLCMSHTFRNEFTVRVMSVMSVMSCVCDYVQSCPNPHSGFGCVEHLFDSQNLFPHNENLWLKGEEN